MFKTLYSQVWLGVSVISGPGRLRKEDCKFKASPSYTPNPCQRRRIEGKKEWGGREGGREGVWRERGRYRNMEIVYILQPLGLFSEDNSIEKGQEIRASLQGTKVWGAAE